MLKFILDLGKPPENDEVTSYLENLFERSNCIDSNITINKKIFNTLVDRLPLGLSDKVKICLSYMNNSQIVIVLVCCAMYGLFQDTSVQNMKRIMGLSQGLLGKVLTYPLYFSSGSYFYEAAIDSLIKLLDNSNDCERPREIPYCEKQAKVLCFCNSNNLCNQGLTLISKFFRLWDTQSVS